MGTVYLIRYFRWNISEWNVIIQYYVILVTVIYCLSTRSNECDSRINCYLIWMVLNSSVCDTAGRSGSGNQRQFVLAVFFSAPKSNSGEFLYTRYIPIFATGLLFNRTVEQYSANGQIKPTTGCNMNRTSPRMHPGQRFSCNIRKTCLNR